MTSLSRYTLLEKIGRSVLGAVYKAQDTQTGTPVALKVLQLGLLDDVSSREMDARLQREFEAAVRLVHPGIARVYEIRRDGKTALIATELVDGPTITSYVKGRIGSDVSLIVAAVVQILEALDFAHGQSVIHRDLKPSNILVSEGKRIKITDFGMADLAARNRDDTGMLVGETQYMAPEQFLSGPTDKRCDIHAVGTILYELLTGQAPFAGDDKCFAAMTKVLELTPPPPSKVRAGLSPVFDRVVARALAKLPAERFATAGRFRDELCAAYFALTRRSPPATLIPAAATPSDSTPVGARTTTVQVRPASWSLSGGAPHGSVADKTTAAKLDVENLEKAPVQPAVEPLAADSYELRSAPPQVRVIPTPDLSGKSRLGGVLLPGALGSPLEAERSSYEAEPLLPSRPAESAPLTTPAARAEIRAETPSPLKSSREPSPPSPPAKSAPVTTPAARAETRPDTPPQLKSSRESADASAAPRGGSSEPAGNDAPARTQYIRMASAPGGALGTPEVASLAIPVDRRPPEPPRPPKADIGPALGVQGMRDRTPLIDAPVTPPAMPAQSAAAPPAGAVEALATGPAAVDSIGPLAAPLLGDPKADPAPARAAPTAKRTIPLTDASIAHGGRVLARFLGPIALVLSRRAAQDTSDERAYYERLAAHLPDPKERTQFLRDLRQRPS